MDIVSHKGWGANYLRPLQRTNVRNKTAFLVHYHGGIPRNSIGTAVPKEVEAIHHANGWNGLGYNFAVDQAGTIYEGYGWDGVGAQCPGFNTSGIGTYVAIGGDQKPSDAALASVRWLYDEGCRRSGNTLRKMGHRDGWATACPGPHLYAWVLDGMPAPANSPEEDDMQLNEQIPLSDAEKRTWGIESLTVADALKAALVGRKYGYTAVARLEAIEAALAQKGVLSAEDVDRISAGIADKLDDEFEVQGDVRLAPKAVQS